MKSTATATAKPTAAEFRNGQRVRLTKDAPAFRLWDREDPTASLPAGAVGVVTEAIVLSRHGYVIWSASDSEFCRPKGIAGYEVVFTVPTKLTATKGGFLNEEVWVKAAADLFDLVEENA